MDHLAMGFEPNGGDFSGAKFNPEWLFVVGIAVFSGSLYVLAITGVTWLGAITPIGGVGFIVGWMLLAYSAMK